MTLNMAQPWKHPKTGIYHVRKRVPADLRQIGERDVVKVSLGTRDPEEARRRFPAELAKLEARWASLRAGPTNLTERQAHDLAVEVYDEFLDAWSDEPSFQVLWHPELYPTLWTADLLPETEGQPDNPGSVPITNIFRRSMKLACQQRADEIIDAHGLVLDQFNHWKLRKAVGAAYQRASIKLARQSHGHYELNNRPSNSGMALENSSAVTSQITQDIASSRAQERLSTFSITQMLEHWWREANAAGRKPSTYESYRNTARNLIKFLGHDDATRVGRDDIINFKDYRLKTPSTRTGRVPSNKTIKDSDLAALKTLFGWALGNGRVSKNPAAGVTVSVSRKQRLRDKGFTEDEAHAILSAARQYNASDRERAGTAAAKRWVPWLCALSGARVGEMGQLRRQDLRREGAHWVLRITPEAGTVKTNEARDVVLHQQLIELGFPTFVETSLDGPLFLTLGKNDDVLGPLQGLKNRLAEFARQVVSDRNVQPNHGWRHLFTTRCEEAGINPRVYNAIMGHAGRTVSERYGDIKIKAIATAISKLPHFKIDSFCITKTLSD